MSIAVIILIALVALLILWVVSVQNKLVRLDEVCKNAFKQINVQQISRFDAIKALVKLTRDYASYEADTLEKVISQRRITSGPAPTAADINGNEAALSEMTAKLIAVAERYPDLKANENYVKTMDSIRQYEENVRLSRMTANDTVTRFNNQVRMFPGSVVASLLGFSQREYLQDEVSKADYPEI